MAYRFTTAYHPRRLALGLLFIAVALAVAHVVAMKIWTDDPKAFGHWRVALLDIDERQSIGTWFTSMLFFFASRLLLAQAGARRQAGGGWHVWWFGLAAGFFYLSLDEIAGLHEQLNRALGDGVVWTLYRGITSALVLMACIPFLIFGLPARTALLFLISGLLYLVGALGINSLDHGFAENEMGYSLWSGLEELLEMCGVIFFLYALLDHLAPGENRPAVVETRIEA